LGSRIYHSRNYLSLVKPDRLTYAVKISWPEENRLDEAEILPAAVEKAKGEDDFTNRIPRVFAMQDFPYRKWTDHKALGIPESKDKHPDSRVLLSPTFELFPPSKKDTFFLACMCPLCMLPDLAYAHLSLKYLLILLGYFKLWNLDLSLANFI